MVEWHIDFAGVGRGKKTWTQTVRQTPTEAVIARLAKKGGQLASRDVEAFFDEDLEHGVITVGGFREVGAFRIRSQSTSKGPHA
jgi:hypothetical protein